MEEDMKRAAFEAVRRALKAQDGTKFDAAREIVLTIDGEAVVIKSNYEEGQQVCASYAMTPIDVANAGWDHSIGIPDEKAVEILRNNRTAIEKAMTDAAYEAIAVLVQGVPSEPTYTA